MGDWQGTKSATTEVLCFQRWKESPPLRQILILPSKSLIFPQLCQWCATSPLCLSCEIKSLSTICEEGQDNGKSNALSEIPHRWVPVEEGDGVVQERAT